MRPNLKLIGSLLVIIILALAATWIVLPQGSKIDLRKIKIPYNKEFSAHLGLDLQGGSHLVYKAELKDIPEPEQAEAMEAIRGTLERRVNSFGVSEPQVQVQGKDKIIIELPGIKDINDAIKQIGQTPYMEFKSENPNPSTLAPDENGQVAVDSDSLWISTGLSGKQLKRATADIQTSSSAGISNNVVVRLEFNDEGKQLFSDITTKNVGKRIAIFLDGQLLSAPTVQNAITDGVAIITGNFTVKDAKELASRLNSGALPVPISLVSQENVGATLGRESIQKSVLAGVLGVLLIALFMIMYYRFPGDRK